MIVFITGSREYIYDAFDVGAMQYLVKPIDPERFRKVYERAKAEYWRISWERDFTVSTGDILSIWHMSRITEATLSPYQTAINYFYPRNDMQALRRPIDVEYKKK